MRIEEHLTMKHPDLFFLGDRVREAWDAHFDSLPPVLRGHPYDEDDQDLIAGKTYQEIAELLDGRLDATSLFLIVGEPACRYYLGSYLLHFLAEAAVSREVYPAMRYHTPLMVTFYTMSGYLQREEALAWLAANPPLCDAVVATLEVMLNTAGFGLTEDDESPLRAARARLVPEDEDDE